MNKLQKIFGHIVNKKKCHEKSGPHEVVGNCVTNIFAKVKWLYFKKKKSEK